MKKKSLFMGTTKIEATKTATEIIEVLVASGARQIATDYGEKGNITGLRFVIAIGSGARAFSLPVRTEALLKHVRNDRAQAERVGWRQLLRWTQAQLAMIEIGMVKAEEVYAPYMIATPDGRTLFQWISDGGMKAIAAPGGQYLPEERS